MTTQVVRLFGRRRTDYTDREVVEGLQQHSRTVEEHFYQSAKRYFEDHFNEVFFDKDRKQEIFQSAFLKLWMEIDNRRIRVVEGAVSRQQKDGCYQPMTCALTTFLMAFARTEYRELVRHTAEDCYPALRDDALQATQPATVFDAEENIGEQKSRIVDECIQQMSPRCIEILTLFYYEGKSLDEILDIRKDKNSSKNGLKTAKNKCMTTLKERVEAEFQKYHF